MVTALTVGRYQPLHIGHVKALEYVMTRADKVIVAVGSSNESFTVENPFTFEERAEMIRKTFGVGSYEVYAVPDIYDEEKWVAHVLKIVPEFDLVYTNGRREMRLFRQAGIVVKEIPFFSRRVYSATEVRKRIRDDKDWRELLPVGTLSVLEAVDGIRRIRSLK